MCAMNNITTLDSRSVRALHFDEFRDCYSSLGVTPRRPFALPEVLALWLKYFVNEGETVFIGVDNTLTNQPSFIPIWKKKMLFKIINSWKTISGRELWHSDVYNNISYNIDKVIDYLLCIDREWDLLKFEFLPKDVIDSIRVVLNRKNISYLNLTTGYSRVIYTNIDFEEYCKTQCWNKMIKRAAKAITSDSTSGFQGIEYHRLPAIKEGISHANEVSRRSWKSTRKTHIAADNPIGHYYQNLFQYFSEKEMLSVYVLYDRQKPIAFSIVIHYNGVAYIVKCDYDMDYSKSSPGNVIWYFALKSLFSNDAVKKIDLLTDYNYLTKWTKYTDEYSSLVMFNNRMKSQGLYWGIKNLLPAVKAVRKWYSSGA